MVSKLQGTVAEIAAVKTAIKRIIQQLVTETQKQIQQVSLKQREINGLYGV